MSEGVGDEKQWIGGADGQQFGPMDWTRALTRLEPTLPECAVRVAHRLFDHYSADRGAFPTIKTLCRGGCGYLKSESSVQDGINALRDAGLIEIESGKEIGRQNTYWLTIPGSGRIGSGRKKSAPARRAASPEWRTGPAARHEADAAKSGSEPMLGDGPALSDGDSNGPEGDRQVGEVVPATGPGVTAEPVRGDRPGGDITQSMNSEGSGPAESNPEESNPTSTTTSASVTGPDHGVVGVAVLDSSQGEQSDPDAAALRRLRFALLDAGVAEPKLTRLLGDPSNTVERVCYHLHETSKCTGLGNPTGLLIKRLEAPEPPERWPEIKRSFAKHTESVAPQVQAYFDEAERIAISKPKYASAIHSSMEMIREVWPTALDLARARPLAYWTKRPELGHCREPAIEAMRDAAIEEREWRDNQRKWREACTDSATKGDP